MAFLASRAGSVKDTGFDQWRARSVAVELINAAGAAPEESTMGDRGLAGLSLRLRRNRLTRRDVLWLFGAGAAASALAGCATSPVTGERILVGMSEEQERQVDRQVAPHQFSQDMGPVQDDAVNRYVAGVGGRMDELTQRPQMPYSYRVLNANYINAYTFPGGTMGVTRGIMTELDSEAELAALLGHEMGHVNARHAAQRQGQQMLSQAAVIGLAVAASVADSSWGGLAAVGGQIGASALLASYSRDNEREADALGQDYMVRAGYPASGMVQLQSLLVRESKGTPSLLETMFATHPMSAERLANAQRLAETRHAASLRADPQRERFMDSTVGLRRLKPAIDACKNGEVAMARKQLPQAQGEFAKALAVAPRDYPSNLLMARCLAAQGRQKEALKYADAARSIYPQEAQAHKLVGVLQLAEKDPAAAVQSFEQFDRLLPGDPGIAFLKGVGYEGSGNQRAAAESYARFLRAGGQGKPAEYSMGRLQAWGYLR
jgi:predicted Zn-dependent protease